MIRRRGDVVWREVDGRIVALELKSSRYFSVNASGAMLWHALEHETDPGALADLLVKAHGIEPSRAGLDVDAFVAELRENGLVEG